MAARRCPICGISYPTNIHTCEVCGGEADYISNDDVTEGWRWVVTFRRRDRLKADLVAEPTPNILEELPITEEHGLFWVKDAAFRAVKLVPPPDRRMFLFHANGHFWEATAYDNTNRRWLVEQIREDLPADTFPVEWL